VRCSALGWGMFWDRCDNAWLEDQPHQGSLLTCASGPGCRPTASAVAVLGIRGGGLWQRHTADAVARMTATGKGKADPSAPLSLQPGQVTLQLDKPISGLLTRLGNAFATLLLSFRRHQCRRASWRSSSGRTPRLSSGGWWRSW